MKRTPAHFALALALSFVSPPILAQTTPAPSSPDDAALAAQKAAFMGMPEASRKAAQEALVWLGLYVGINDGDFGKPTRDAIRAFQASLKAPADGTLSAPELKSLLAAAQKAREAAGFQIVSDPKTGAQVGAPLRLLRAFPGARLDFAANADADLGDLYARLSAATPSRKIDYKEIKPDAFFVVSGRDGPVKFYTRFDKNPTASSADPRLHLRLSSIPRRHPRPNCDRHCQFIRAVPRVRGGAGSQRQPSNKSHSASRTKRWSAPAVPQPGATAPTRQAQVPKGRSGGFHGGGGWHAGGWHGNGWSGGWAGPAIVGGLATGALLAAPYAYGSGCTSYAPVYDAYGNYVGQQPVDGCYDHSEGRGAAANQREPQITTAAPSVRKPLAAKPGEPRPTAAPAAPAAKEAPPPPPPPLAAAPNQTLPEFPWPPPKASASYVLPEELFPPDTTIGRVVKRIIFALEQNGYVERSFFRTKVGGTVMVTRLERVNKDGSSYSGDGRWPASASTDGLDITRSLIDVLRGLFFVDRGHYKSLCLYFRNPPLHSPPRKSARGRPAHCCIRGRTSCRRRLAQAPTVRAAAPF